MTIYNLNAIMYDSLGAIPLAPFEYPEVILNPQITQCIKIETYASRAMNNTFTHGQYITFGATFIGNQTKINRDGSDTILIGSGMAGGFIRFAEQNGPTCVYVGVNPYNNSGDIVVGGYNQGYTTVLSQSSKPIVYLAAVLDTINYTMKVYADGQYIGIHNLLSSDVPETGVVGVVYDPQGGGIAANGPYYINDVFVVNGEFPLADIQKIYQNHRPFFDYNQFKIILSPCVPRWHVYNSAPVSEPSFGPTSHDYTGGMLPHGKYAFFVAIQEWAPLGGGSLNYHQTPIMIGIRNKSGGSSSSSFFGAESYDYAIKWEFITNEGGDPYYQFTAYNNSDIISTFPSLLFPGFTIFYDTDAQTIGVSILNSTQDGYDKYDIFTNVPLTNAEIRMSLFSVPVNPNPAHMISLWSNYGYNSTILPTGYTYLQQPSRGVI